jgi:anionic cell wall polymer biosynthesis LytR-Cps2A-Psr (LCP) family protein
MNGVFKKITISFFVALMVFSLSALAFAGALSIGRGAPDADESKEENGSVIEDGSSFSVLFIMTDYAPDLFSDYSKEHIKNVFGIDNTSSSVQGFGRKINAEDMVLMRFDKARGEITFTLIPGNLLVTVRNVKTKLETVAANYGTDVLIEKIRAITGLWIDSYAIFTPDSAAALFDRIGEITYTVKNGMTLKDESRGIDINIDPGSQKFNGRKAVDFLRFDAYKKASDSRTEYMVGFMKRVLKKISDRFNSEELLAIIHDPIDGAKGNFFEYLDRDNAELVLSFEKMTFKALEIVGEEQMIGEESYFVLDETKTLEKFKSYRKTHS